MKPPQIQARLNSPSQPMKSSIFFYYYYDYCQLNYMHGRDHTACLHLSAIFFDLTFLVSFFFFFLFFLHLLKLVSDASSGYPSYLLVCGLLWSFIQFTLYLLICCIHPKFIAFFVYSICCRFRCFLRFTFHLII